MCTVMHLVPLNINNNNNRNTFVALMPDTLTHIYVTTGIIPPKWRP